jgi:hypothetical protein
MAKCNKCGAEAKQGVKYCKACGAGISAADSGLKDKKARVMAGERRWVKPLVVAGVAILAAAGIWLAQGASGSKMSGERPVFAAQHDPSLRLANAAQVRDEGGNVNIPLAVLEDGKARFFAYASGGKTVTFFVIKTADGAVRAALDACTACNHARLGYRQESGMLVCNNCGMGFKPAEVGTVTGGCSPIPVEKSVNGETLVVKSRDLDSGARYF